MLDKAARQLTGQDWSGCIFAARGLVIHLSWVKKKNERTPLNGSSLTGRVTLIEWPGGSPANHLRVVFPTTSKQNVFVFIFFFRTIPSFSFSKDMLCFRYHPMSFQILHLIGFTLSCTHHWFANYSYFSLSSSLTTLKCERKPFMDVINFVKSVDS